VANKKENAQRTLNKPQRWQSFFLRPLLLFAPFAILNFIHSVLKLFTGFAIAAFTALKLIVNNPTFNLQLIPFSNSSRG
jgi:hypothetical protein